LGLFAFVEPALEAFIDGKKEVSCKLFVKSNHISELLLMMAHLLKLSSHLKRGFAIRAKENIHCTQKILQLQPQQGIVIWEDHVLHQ
jgi:hypothetical protein